MGDYQAMVSGQDTEAAAAAEHGEEKPAESESATFTTVALPATQLKAERNRKFVTAVVAIAFGLLGLGILYAFYDIVTDRSGSPVVYTTWIG